MSRGFGLLLCCSVFLFVSHPTAQSGTVRYIYDELGRLVAVIDGAGASATYHYDAVGNLLSITRAVATDVTIIEFTPDGGGVGQSVTIYGTGFSTTPSSNSVSFNGTAASVTSSTANTIVTSVPSGATTGTISITSPNGSANSSTNFVVGAASAPASRVFLDRRRRGREHHREREQFRDDSRPQPSGPQPQPCESRDRRRVKSGHDRALPRGIGPADARHPERHGDQYR